MKAPTPDQLIDYAAHIRLVHQFVRAALATDGADSKQFYLEHIAHHLNVDLSSITYEKGIAPFSTKNPSAAGVQDASNSASGYPQF